MVNVPVPVEVRVPAPFGARNNIPDDLIVPRIGTEISRVFRADRDWETGYGIDYNGNDFLAWQQQFGFSQQGGVPAALVPEPDGMVVIVSFVLWMWIQAEGSWLRRRVS